MKNAISSSIDQDLAFIFGRRSIRAYTPEPVSNEAVQKLLEAAMAATSAGTCDPWRFIVVRNREMLSRIGQALPYNGIKGSGAVCILVCGDLEATHDKQLSYLLQDCSAAIQNLLLCAHVLGLGACWLGVHPREHRVKTLQTIFALPEHVIPVACVAVGHPAETKEARTRFRRERVRFED